MVNQSQFIELFGNPMVEEQKCPLKKLGDCCIINPKRSKIALSDPDPVSFVPMPSVSEEGYLQDVSDAEYGSVKKGFTYFENGDVLFAKITPCMENGKGAIAHDLTNGIGMGSTEFHVLRPLKGISNSYWLLTLTRLPEFRDRAAHNMSGTGGQQRVRADFLENFMIGLPPIEKQIELENVCRVADKSKFAGFKSQFIEMFGDPITNSKKCIVKKGSELFIFSSGKANTRANLNASYKYDCFGGNGTTGKSKDYLIDFTTLVIGRVGEYCGSVHITPTYSWITDNAIYIKDFKDKDLDIRYLYYLFRFLDLHRLSAKTGQPKITQEALLGIDYICPSVEEQKGYVTFAHHADKSKYLN